MDTLAVLDFGSQTTQLIARRIRDRGIYTEIVPCDVTAAELSEIKPKGIIFSGSPYSVYEQNAPEVDRDIYELGLPILGICYGMHRMITDFGGRVDRLETKEFGRSRVFVEERLPLLEKASLNPEMNGRVSFTAWMSHGDSIDRLPEGFIQAASSEKYPAVVYSRKRNFYGFQFHPEVTHCEHGSDLLEGFAADICGAGKDWSIDAYLAEISEELRARAADRNVLLLISGGVDSTVVAGLLLKTLDPARVHLMYIDTGLMRKGESDEVAASLELLGAENLHLIDARDEFLRALERVSDPEEKRKVIGDLFITIQEREVGRLEIPGALLAQGTLYTDLIESGKGVGKKAQVIKSHHNVRSPLVEGKRDQGLVIEPLSRLYKDEVRALGTRFGLSAEVIGRHPFPGPGLAVRILGPVTEERCRILREADFLFLGELKRRGLYDKIWQAFTILLPIQSVGVTGDVRHYGWVLALRAVTSEDGMTADVYPFESEDLLEISALITNTLPEIGRVVYDVSSKPPATIEWE
jgi:GMP synthase (glutamine-hydrolysing)